MDDMPEELISPNGTYKAVIQRQSATILTVTFFKWTHEIGEGYGEVCNPYWDRISGPIWTDTLVQAKQLAHAELRLWTLMP